LTSLPRLLRRRALIPALAAALLGMACVRAPGGTDRPSTAAAPTDKASVEPSEETVTEDQLPTLPDESVSDAGPIEPRYPFQNPLPDPTLERKARPPRFSNLGRADCLRAFRQDKLPLADDRRGPGGVAMPVRFGGNPGPVTFFAPPRKSPFGAFDCRLGLAFHQLVPLLSEHEVTEVHIGTLYRPPPRRGAKHPRHSQHTRGLAADVIGFKLKDGRTLVVERDWQGAIGSPACGPRSALRDPTDEAIRLRNLLCAIARTKLFDTILTPNYDAAHHDHMHLDLRRDARAVILR
jgi:hypothetical protein